MEGGGGQYQLGLVHHRAGLPHRPSSPLVAGRRRRVVRQRCTGVERLVLWRRHHHCLEAQAGGGRGDHTLLPGRSHRATMSW